MKPKTEFNLVNATSSLIDGLNVKSATTTDTLKLGGSLWLANSETVGNATNNNVFVNSTGISLATSTATTTNGVWVGAQAGKATSTLIIGGGNTGDATANPGCIELWREGSPYKIEINATGDGVTAGIGRCTNN